MSRASEAGGSPVAVVGIDPLLFAAARYQVPPGLSELDWVGGLRQKPLPVLRAKYSDLPIPANSEIVLEGELRHGGREEVRVPAGHGGHLVDDGLHPPPEPGAAGPDLLAADRAAGYG
jgi:hypothetical protein